MHEKGKRKEKKHNVKSLFQVKKGKTTIIVIDWKMTNLKN